VRVPLAAMRRSPRAGSAGATMRRPRLEQPDELQGLRVLIVDDGRQHASSLPRCSPHAARPSWPRRSVLAAKTAIEAGVPDVLISDIGMPTRTA